MADLAAANITYSFDLNNASCTPGRHGKKLLGTISFGNGTLEMPLGGLPLDGGKMGCPHRVFSLQVINCHGAKYARFEYDPATGKLNIQKVRDTASPNGDLISLEASPSDREAPVAVVLDVEVIGY